METNKSKKILLPIAIVLAILTAAFVVLSITVAVTGRHSSTAKKAQSFDASTETDSGYSEPVYVEDYELDDFSTAGTATSDDSTADETTDDTTDKLSDTEGYIIANSADAALTDADLEGLTAQELTYARNEIYARHGYVFQSSELNEYFATKSWYEADESFDGTLSDTERANAEFINNYQSTNNLTYEPS